MHQGTYVMCPPGGFLNWLQDSCLVVRVHESHERDTGPGLAPAHMARLFTPFDRLDAEHGPVPGTGLGLAVSRQLMQHMGGEIAAHSTLGEGSRFELRLRVAAIEPLTAPQLADLPSMPLKIAAAGERCVLAIEDNPSNLALLQALVSRRPQWRLVTVRDGAEGLAKVRAQPPDLLLLDLHLPGMGGEALLANLRADPVLQKLPIVIISADALPDTIERLRAAGANDYLTKPLAVPRLLALLDQYAA